MAAKTLWMTSNVLVNLVIMARCVKYVAYQCLQSPSCGLTFLLTAHKASIGICD